MHADEHAGAMCMTTTMMRPGLFFQREGPGIVQLLPHTHNSAKALHMFTRSAVSARLALTIPTHLHAAS